MTWQDAFNLCDAHVDPPDIEAVVAAAHIGADETIEAIASPKVYYINNGRPGPGSGSVDLYLLVTDRRTVLGRKGMLGAKIFVDAKYDQFVGFNDDPDEGSRGEPVYQLLLQQQTGNIRFVFRTESARNSIHLHVSEQVRRAMGY